MPLCLFLPQHTKVPYFFMLVGQIHNADVSQGRSLSIMLHEAYVEEWILPVTLVALMYPFSLKMLSLEVRCLLCEVPHLPSEVYLLPCEVCCLAHLSLGT